jgi:hypothetical protein
VRRIHILQLLGRCDRGQMLRFRTSCTPRWRGVTGLAVAVAVLVAGFATPRVARCQMTGMAGMSEMPAGDSGTGGTVTASMSGGLEESAHMRMTKLAPPQPGDAERAAAIVTVLRKALEPYRDYHHALADGYRIFAPRIKQHVYHFTNRRLAFLSILRFDPAEPSSLLYERTGDSTYRLVGAMYTAPRRASVAQLDARVPLSVAQWHVHANFCLPPHPFRMASYTARGPDGQPLFGARGTVATEAACEAAGGRFIPQVFGWMVHVYPFATDPAKIWAGDMH